MLDASGPAGARTCSARSSSAGARIGLAALLVLLGTLAERWTLVVPAFLGHAHFFFANGGYHPSLAEILTTLGTYALGLLACRLLVTQRIETVAKNPRARVKLRGQDRYGPPAQGPA